MTAPGPHGYAIADFPRLEAPMTPKRYQQCLTILNQSQRGLAPLLHCSEKLPRLWAIGERTIPTLVAKWLETCAKNRLAHPDPVPPTPKQWRTVPGMTATGKPRVNAFKDKETGARMARTGPAPNLFKEFHKSSAPRKKPSAAKKRPFHRSIKHANSP